FNKALRRARYNAEGKFREEFNDYFQEKPPATVGELIRQCQKSERFYHRLAFAEYFLGGERINQMAMDVHGLYIELSGTLKKVLKSTPLGSGLWPGGIDFQPVPEQPGLLADIVIEHNRLSQLLRANAWPFKHADVKDIGLTLNLDHPLNPS